MKKYQHVALGGTFDHFHIGHKKIISKTLELSHTITIGLSTEKLYKKKPFSTSIESYQKRQKAILNYITVLKFIGKVHFIKLTDIYGTAISDKSLEAIVVTEETNANAQKINAKRKEDHRGPLKIITIPLVKGDDNQIIRSERIRSGEIDREGRSYKRLFSSKKVLNLPDNLRPQLQKPLGKVLSMSRVGPLTKVPTLIITIGDVVTASLLKKKIVPGMAIFDYKVRRKPVIFPELSKYKNLTSMKNDPGTINELAVKEIHRSIKRFIKNAKPQQIVISGEEDLLALPAILLSPLDSLVLYGQPSKGMVTVKIDEAIKKIIMALVKKFD